MAGCAASTARVAADLCADMPCRGGRTATWRGRSSSPGRGVRRPRGDRPCQVPGCPRPGGSPEAAVPHPPRAAGTPSGPAGSGSGWPARTCGRCPRSAPASWPRARRRRRAGTGCATRITRRGAAAAAGTPAPPWPIWARHASPASAAAHTVVLRGLPERVVAELLAGLQRRTDAGLRTRPDSLRCLVNLLHARRAASVLDLAGVPSTAIRPDCRGAAAVAAGRAALRAVRPGAGTGQGRVAAGRARASRHAGLHRASPSGGCARQPSGGPPKTCRCAGASGPHRRPGTPSTRWRRCRSACACPATTAATTPATLGRADIVAFTSRLAHLQRTGQMTCPHPAAVHPPGVPVPQRPARPGDDRPGPARRRAPGRVRAAPQRHPQGPRPRCPPAQPAPALSCR